MISITRRSSPGCNKVQFGSEVGSGVWVELGIAVGVRGGVSVATGIGLEIHVFVSAEADVADGGRLGAVLT